jgi:hypothetical protein
MSITTSAAYKTAIKADTEETALKAEFGFITPGAVEGATLSGSAQADASRLSQVKNTNYEMGAKWGTGELNQFVLNGTMKLISKNDPAQKIGFISNTFSDDNGQFADPHPYVDYILDAPYDLIGVMAFFDDKIGDYATNVTVTYFNSAGTQVLTQTFSNTETIRRFNMPAIGVKRIRITINSWSRPRRMVRIPTILPGQIYQLGQFAFGFEFSEEIKPFEPSITFPEFTVTFDNSSKEFDIVNPQGLMSYLRRKMKIDTKIGIRLADGSFEYISTGNYYVYAWPENSQEDSAQFTCRPSMAFINTYYVNAGRGTQTVAQACAIIFAGSSEAYTIESGLESIVVNQYIGENVPLVNAMGQLAIAAAAYWKIDRDGTYHLKKWQNAAPANTVDYDNAWSKPSIQQGKKITSVNVKYYTWDSTNEQLKDNDNIVSQTTNDGDMKEIQSCFIPTKVQADAVATAALNYYSNRLSYSQNYRGDMSMEVGDYISVENDYGESKILILSHELSWDEANKLNGELKGLGVVT